MSLSNRTNIRGGGEAIPVNTILNDLIGLYSGLATKTSTIKVPAILAGQKLRITGKNNVSVTYNYQIVIAFSTDGVTWNNIHTTTVIPFPTSGAQVTLDIDITPVLGNSGYFRISITGDGRASNTITSAIVGTFN